MNLRKTSILVLCGLMSYDSLAALPSGRISTLRIGATSADNRSATASSTNRAATVSNYSKVATNQARASTTKALDGITSNADSIAELKTAMQEMQAQMNDALEQMNETLAEKDEVIQALSKEVTDYKSKYEEIKSAVEAMDDMMDDVAKADDLKVITTDLKAVQAKAEENKNNFKNYATLKDLNDLDVGTDESTVNKIVDGKLLDFAKVKDVKVIETDLQAVQAKAEENTNNFKNYATLKDLNNLELGTDESTVNKIIDSKLADFAPMEALESVLAKLKANDQLSERYKEQIAELEAKMEDIRVRADSHDSYQDLIADLRMHLDDIRARLVAYVTREELEMYAKLDDLKSVKVGADEDQVTKIIDSKLVGFATAEDLKLFAKAEDLQNLKVGIDEATVTGIVDNKLTKYATTEDLQKMSTGPDEATLEKLFQDHIAGLDEESSDLERRINEIASVINAMAGENMVEVGSQGNTLIRPLPTGDFRSLKDLTYELGMVSMAHEIRDTGLRGGTPSKMSDPSRLDTAKEQIAVLENALKELDSNFKTWQEQESERGDRIGEMNERIGEIIKIREEQENINNTIIELTKGENSPFAKLPELQKTLDNLQGKSVEITELHKQIAALQEQVTTNLKTTEGLKVDVVKVKNYADDIKAIQNMIEALKGSDGDIFADAIEKLEAELAELKEKNNTFSDQFARFTGDFGGFKSRLEQAETKLVQIKETTDETAADVKETKTTLSANAKEIDAFKTWKNQVATKDDVTGQVNNLRNTLDNSMNQMKNDLAGERDRVEQELAKVRAEQEAAIDAAAREEAEARERALQAQLNRLNSAIAQGRAEREYFEQGLQAARDELAQKIQAERDRLEQDLAKEAKARQDALLAERDKLEQELQAERDRLKQELQAERTRIAQELAKARAEQETAIDAAAKEEAKARQDALLAERARLERELAKEAKARQDALLAERDKIAQELQAERERLERELARLRVERDAAIKVAVDTAAEELTVAIDKEAEERQKAIGNLSNLYAPIGVERTLNNIINVELPKYATQTALTLVSDKVATVSNKLNTVDSTLLQLGSDLENTKSTVSGLSVSTSGGTVQPTTTSSTSRKVSGY